MDTEGKGLQVVFLPLTFLLSSTGNTKVDDGMQEDIPRVPGESRDNPLKWTDRTVADFADSEWTLHRTTARAVADRMPGIWCDLAEFWATH